MSLYLNWSHDEHVEEVSMKAVDSIESNHWPTPPASTGSFSAAHDLPHEDPFATQSTARLPPFPVGGTMPDPRLSTSAWPSHLGELLPPINTERPGQLPSDHPDSPVKLFESGVRDFAALPVDHDPADDLPQTSPCCVCGRHVDRVGLQEHVQNCFYQQHKTAKTPSPGPRRSSPAVNSRDHALSRLLPLVAQLPLEQRIQIMQGLTRLSHVANKTLSPVQSPSLSPKATPQDEQILQLIYKADASASPPPLRLLGDVSPSSSCSDSEDRPFPAYHLPGSAFNLVDDGTGEDFAYTSPYGSPSSSTSGSDTPPALEHGSYTVLSMVKEHDLEAQHAQRTQAARPVRGTRFPAGNSPAAGPKPAPVRQDLVDAAPSTFLSKRKRGSTSTSNSTGGSDQWLRARRVKIEPQA